MALCSLFNALSHPLLPPHNLFYLIQFIQGFDRGKIINVKRENLIPNLTENRVVKLEERQLHSFPLGGIRHVLHGRLLPAAILSLQFSENDVGTLHNRFWHAGNLCHMNTE